MEVLNTIGHGLHEKIYERALAVEFRIQQVPFVRQPEYPVIYKSVQVGTYIPDIISFNQIVVDTKTVEELGDRELGQTESYFTESFVTQSYEVVSYAKISFLLAPFILNVHPSTFILQRSSFNVHPSTFILQRLSFNVYPSTFILGKSSLDIFFLVVVSVSEIEFGNRKQNPRPLTPIVPIRHTRI